MTIERPSKSKDLPTPFGDTTPPSEPREDPAPAPAEEAPQRPEPERALSVEQWVNDVAVGGEAGNAALGLPWRTHEDPPYELLGGFVHKMRSEGLLAAKPSDYRERWEAFLKE